MFVNLIITTFLKINRHKEGWGMEGIVTIELE